jgi:hypothetical protein
MKLEKKKYISNFFHRQRYKSLRGKSLKKSRTWILEKKDRWRTKGRYKEIFVLKPTVILRVFILEMFDPIQNIRHENDQKLFERYNPFFLSCHQYYCFDKK